MIINGTREPRTLQIAAISTYTICDRFASEMSIEGYLLDTLTLALGFNQTHGMAHAKSATLLFVSISFRVLSFKRYKESMLLKM